MALSSSSDGGSLYPPAAAFISPHTGGLFRNDRSKKELEKSASNLFAEFAKKGIESKIVESKAQCGGGTLPHLEIDSYAVRLSSESKKFAEQTHKKLLELDKPVLAILREGNLLFDLLSLNEDDFPEIARAVKEII